MFSGNSKCVFGSLALTLTLTSNLNSNSDPNSNPNLNPNLTLTNATRENARRDERNWKLHEAQEAKVRVTRRKEPK